MSRYGLSCWLTLALSATGLALLPSRSAHAAAEPAPCSLTCDIGQEEFAIRITCETGTMSESLRDRSEFDYGPSGERNVLLTLDRERTYTPSGRTYRVQGWIRIDRAAGRVSHDIVVSGGALASPLECKAGPSAPGPRGVPPARPSPSPQPDAEILAPPDYQSGIAVPECERAREGGKLPGETWACFSSEKGEYVGRGRLWLLPGASKPMTVSYAAFGGRVDGRVDVAVADGGAKWEASFSPPKGATWKAGRYETMRDAFQDAEHAGLSVSAHSSGCGEETGVLELLELQYDAKTRTVTRLRANVEQACQGKRLRGQIRFLAR